MRQKSLIYEEIQRIEWIFDNLYTNSEKHEKSSKIKGCRDFCDV